MYKLVEAAEYMNEMFPGEINSYETILREGDEYIKADMTPLFLLDKRSAKLLVTAEETFGKRLH